MQVCFIIQLQFYLDKAQLRQHIDQSEIQSLYEKMQQYSQYVNIDLTDISISQNDISVNSPVLSFISQQQIEQVQSPQSQVKANQQNYQNNSNVFRFENPSILAGNQSYEGQEIMSYYQNLAQLDYSLIQRVLKQSVDTSQICSLLQALRWRLTKTRKQQRKEMIAEYIQNDVLGVQNNILSSLLSRNRPIKDFSVKLMSIIALEIEGIMYLVQEENITVELVRILFGEESDTILRQNTIQVLQKFSLKKKAQNLMIEMDVLQWLIKVLKYPQHLHDSSLEYSTALLMNLSLKSAGKIKLENTEIIQLIMQQYLQHPNQQVRMYINGILYSILQRETIRKQALQLKLDFQIKQLAENSEQFFQRQLQYILEQLNNEIEEENLSTSQEDSEQIEEEDLSQEEINLEELEEEFQDDISIVQGQPQGEILLCQFYKQKSQQLQMSPVEQESQNQKQITQRFNAQTSKNSQKVPQIQQNQKQPLQKKQANTFFTDYSQQGQQQGQQQDFINNVTQQNKLNDQQKLSNIGQQQQQQGKNQGYQNQVLSVPPKQNYIQKQQQLEQINAQQQFQYQNNSSIEEEEFESDEMGESQILQPARQIEVQPINMGDNRQYSKSERQDINSIQTGRQKKDVKQNVNQEQQQQQSGQKQKLAKSTQSQSIQQKNYQQNQSTNKQQGKSQTKPQKLKNEIQHSNQQINQAQQVGNQQQQQKPKQNRQNLDLQSLQNQLKQQHEEPQKVQQKQNPEEFQFAFASREKILRTPPYQLK